MHPSPDDVDPTVEATSPRAEAETTARRSLDAARSELTALRVQRDGLNDRIRVLVAQVDTLAVVVAAFDRRRQAEDAAAEPGRRRGRRAERTEAPS